MADEIQNIKIRITTDADFSDLDKSLQKLTVEEKALKDQIHGVDEAAQKAGKSLTEETNKANTAVNTTNKGFKELHGTVSGLAQNIPGAFQVQQILNFARTIQTATVSTGMLSSAMGVLKVALAATGIGALVLALSSLAAYFFKTEQGSEALERGLASVGAVVDVIIGKFAALGTGIIKLFSGDFKEAAKIFEDAFKNIGAEISNAAKEANAFTKELQDIEDEENNLAVSVAQTRNEIQKLLIQSRNRTLSEKERLDLLQQAEALETKIVNQQIALQERKVAALQKENDLKVKSGEIDKGNKTEKLRQAEIELANLRGNSLELLEKIQNREDALLQLQEERANKLKSYYDLQNQYRAKDLGLERKKNEDDVKDTKESLDGKSKLQQLYYKNLDAQRKKDEEANQAVLDRDYQKALEDKANRAAIKQQSADLAIEITNGLFQLASENRQAEIQGLQAQQQAELKAVGDNKQAQAVINARYAKEVAKLKQKDAQADKQQALFNIGIQTAQNTVKAFPNPVLIALAIALGAAQAAFVSARPIPKFKDGTKGLTGGNGGVDDILIYANRGEGIMPTDRMKDYQPAFNAIFDRKVPADFLNSIVLNYDRLGSMVSAPQADMSGLKTEIRALGNKLDKLQTLNVTMDQKGFKSYLSKGASKTELENNYLRVG